MVEALLDIIFMTCFNFSVSDIETLLDRNICVADTSGHHIQWICISCAIRKCWFKYICENSALVQS